MTEEPRRKLCAAQLLRRALPYLYAYGEENLGSAMPDEEMMQFFQELHDSGYSYNDGHETFRFDELSLGGGDVRPSSSVSYRIDPVPTAGIGERIGHVTLRTEGPESAAVTQDVPLNADGTVTVRIRESANYDGEYSFQTPSGTLASLDVDAIRNADDDDGTIEYSVEFERSEAARLSRQDAQVVREAAESALEELEAEMELAAPPPASVEIVAERPITTVLPFSVQRTTGRDLRAAWLTLHGLDDVADPGAEENEEE